jgi:hypothetical protein
VKAIAKRVLKFIVDHEDDVPIFCTLDLIVRKFGEAKADEGLDELFARRFIDYAEEYWKYYATPAGLCAVMRISCS